MQTLRSPQRPPLFHYVRSGPEERSSQRQDRSTTLVCLGGSNAARDDPDHGRIPSCRRGDVVDRCQSRQFRRSYRPSNAKLGRARLCRFDDGDRKGRGRTGSAGRDRAGAPALAGHRGRCDPVDLPGARRHRPARRSRRQELCDRVCDRAARSLERAAPVPGRRRLERIDPAAAWPAGHRRCARAGARLCRRLHRQRPSGRRVRRLLHEGPGGGAQFRPGIGRQGDGRREGDHRPLLRPGAGALLLRRLLDRRPRRHDRLAALPRGVRRHRRRRAGDAHGPLQSRPCLGQPRLRADLAQGRERQARSHQGVLAIGPEARHRRHRRRLRCQGWPEGRHDLQYPPVHLRSGVACLQRRQDRCLSLCRSGERACQGLRRPEELARRASPIRPSHGTAASPRRALRSPASSPPARAVRSIPTSTRRSMSTPSRTG